MTQKLLFTPGPLTTSRSVKEAMLTDYGSRDTAFVGIVKDIRQRLLQLGGVDDRDYATVITQGSGTFGIESVISSVIPPGGKLLVLVNGAYGKRIMQIAKVQKIEAMAYTCPENQTHDLAHLEMLLADNSLTHIAAVHCETTTGIFNPIKAIGEIAKRFSKTYIVDAMSSFGAVPVNLRDSHIDYLVSSSNKCIEGVPGFSFTLACKEKLLATEGWSRTLSLDLLAQYKGLEQNGQFRFTPPTHALAAFHQALVELDNEGGVAARMVRYQDNHQTLVDGMRKLGFKEYLPKERQGWIITSFYYPAHSNFDFEEFYLRLNARDFVIYPGKLTDADCFRIGNIGHVTRSDIEALLTAIKNVSDEMGVVLDAPSCVYSHVA